MIWSISGDKQFRACERQWYYRNIVADGRVKKDPYRREITVLSKLQNMEAFRGKVVDDIISRLIVASLNRRFSLNKGYYINEALGSFERQLAFAKAKNYRDPGMIIGEEPDYAALYENEFEGGITAEAELQARADIETALSNFIDNKSLVEYLKSASYLISQRPLTYGVNRFTAKGVPDLIAFFDKEPPHIFDWKVHTFGTNTYEEQLVSYAYALHRVNSIKPHTDFPENLSQFALVDYRLSECQLLHKERIKRDYELTAERIVEFEHKLSSSILEMYRSGGFKKYGQAPEENFSTTLYPENCADCAFKKICKQDSHEIRN